MVVSSLSSVLVFSTPAHAVPNGPGCHPGSVHVVWARGSGSNLYANEFQAFAGGLARQRSVLKLPALMSFVEVGNFDKDDKLKSREYHAVGIEDWHDKRLLDGYGKSVEIGTNELIAYLNHRVSRPGCDKEAIVLGGYSQGADVIGWALERNGWGSLNGQVRSQIAYVAFYGDPRAARYNALCTPYAWARGNAECLHGVLGARWPYFPSYLRERTGSWCDIRDGVCNAYVQAQGSHTTIYPEKWIPDSSREIALAATDKAVRLYNTHGTLMGMKSRNTSALSKGMRLEPNQYIRSINRHCSAAMQPNGNLVVRREKKVLWSSNTAYAFGTYLGLQGDGNMVMYHNGHAT